MAQFTEEQQRWIDEDDYTLTAERMSRDPARYWGWVQRRSEVNHSNQRSKQHDHEVENPA